MTSERTQQALGRIEAALARIGPAAAQAKEAAAAQARQHAALRAAVSETLHDLDRLIAAQNGESRS